LNLYLDNKQNTLEQSKKYTYDFGQSSFTPNTEGLYGENEIKVLKLYQASTNFIKINAEQTLKDNLAKLVMDLLKYDPT
jgi:hypothetical protein